MFSTRTKIINNNIEAYDRNGVMWPGQCVPSLRYHTHGLGGYEDEVIPQP